MAGVGPVVPCSAWEERAMHSPWDLHISYPLHHIHKFSFQKRRGLSALSLLCCLRRIVSLSALHFRSQTVASYSMLFLMGFFFLLHVHASNYPFFLLVQFCLRCCQVSLSFKLRQLTSVSRRDFRDRQWMGHFNKKQASLPTNNTSAIGVYGMNQVLLAELLGELVWC